MTLAYKQCPPLCRSSGNGRWVTAEPYPFSINGVSATVPVGFLTDLYSVPWPLTLIVPRDQASMIPALIHDWLFATVGLRPTARDPSIFSLQQCNQALYQAACECELSWFQRRLIIRGLLIGSWRPWCRLKARGYSVEKPCMREAPEPWEAL